MNLVLPPEELAAICAERLARHGLAPLASGGRRRDWPEWPEFDWPGYTRVYFELLAGNPPNWGELVEAAGQVFVKE